MYALMLASTPALDTMNFESLRFNYQVLDMFSLQVTAVRPATGGNPSQSALGPPHGPGPLMHAFRDRGMESRQADRGPGNNRASQFPLAGCNHAKTYCVHSQSRLLSLLL